MDDVVNRLARELADAIGAAVTEDPQVEACREKARAAGYEMRRVTRSRRRVRERVRGARQRRNRGWRKRTAARWRSPPTTGGSFARCALRPTRSDSASSKFAAVVLAVRG